VEDAIAAADAAAAVRDQLQQQQQRHQGHLALPPPGTTTSSSSSDGSDADLAVLMSSAADKLYKQRLRELQSLMSPEGLSQLQLTRQQYDSLQVCPAHNPQSLFQQPTSCGFTQTIQRWLTSAS
jgi:hypothetical protein